MSERDFPVPVRDTCSHALKQCVPQGCQVWTQIGLDWHKIIKFGDFNIRSFLLILSHRVKINRKLLILKS